MTFFELEAWDCAPPYWINIGEVAIPELAGCTLIEQAVLLGFLMSLTLSFGIWYMVDSLLIVFGF